jgi:hypothetical protein
VTDSHTLFDSLDEMLSVEAMSALEARAVSDVSVRRWTPELAGPASKCEFLNIESVGANYRRQLAARLAARLHESTWEPQFRLSLPVSAYGRWACS